MNNPQVSLLFMRLHLLLHFRSLILLNCVCLCNFSSLFSSVITTQLIYTCLIVFISCQVFSSLLYAFRFDYFSSFSFEYIFKMLVPVEFPILSSYSKNARNILNFCFTIVLKLILRHVYRLCIVS